MNPAYLRPVADHLWQSTAFAGVVGLLTLALRTNRARVRHWLWLTASCKFLIPLSVLIVLGGHLAWRRTPSRTYASLSVVMQAVGEPFSDQAVSVPLLPSAPSAQNLFPAVLLAIWICGFAGIAFSWWIRWRRILAIVRAGTPVPIAAPIPARSSPTLLEPGVFGIFWPVLLLPQDIFERLTPAQLQAVIAHELCHVRHRDNLIAAIHMFVETVFWFHPLVWWIGTQMVGERERACDEEVLSLGSDPRVYAQGILDVCKLYLAAPMPCVSGVSGSDLRKRIEAILKNQAAARLSFTRKAVLAGAAIVAVAAPLAVGILNAPFAHAQSKTTSALQFEVASLKPARPSPDGRSSPKCKGGPGTSDPGLFTCVDYTFDNLLAEAFDLAFYQLPNAYGDRSRYEIDGKVPPGTTRAQFRSMLQNLLIERFRLRYHFEKKEIPVYNLAVAKGGLKMKEAVPDPPSDPDAPRPPNRSRIDLRAGKWTAYGVRVGSILSVVEGEVQAPVTDSTGLQGKYDFTLTWAGRAAPPNDDSEPTLLEAIEQQLGIKVEQKKGEVDVLLIDNAEKTPIAN